MSILKHPNIVQLIEVIDDPTNDHVYIVQELCSGEIMPDADNRWCDAFGFGYC